MRGANCSGIWLNGGFVKESCNEGAAGRLGAMGAMRRLSLHDQGKFGCFLFGSRERIGLGLLVVLAG